MENKILTPYKRLMGLIKVDKKDITQIYIYAIFVGLTNLSLPLGIQAIINLIQMGQISTSWIVLVIFVVAGILFGGILQLMQLRITENLQQKIFVRSSFEFSYRLPRFKLSAIQNLYAPELVNRFFDTMTVQKGLPKLLIDFSTAILQIVFSLILLSLYHPFFIAFSFFLLILLILLMYLTSKRGLDTSINESKYKYAVAHWLEEVARTMNTFKLAGKTDLPTEKTDRLVQSYIGYREGHFKVLVVQFLQLIGFKALIALGLLLIGGLLVINQQMNIGQFIASEIIILLVISSVEKIIMNMDNVYDVLTALDKIGHVTDIPLEKQRHKKCKMRETNLPFKVELKDVQFKYPEQKKWILDGFSMNLAPGQHTAIIGRNGSGKTSILNVLAGLYPISTGSLCFDDVTIGDIDLENLRSRIGDFMSDEQLFIGTIEENITMGRESISQDDLLWACENAGLMPQINELSEGFSTIINPNGKEFSRSMIQKLVLARSIADRPKLLLMDDEQSFLNDKLDHQMFSFLCAENAPWTLVAVTDNENWLAYFRQIIVMEEGKAIFSGDFKAYQIFKSK